MHANLYGDFVKGRDLSKYAPIIEKGIRLHREIDHFVDNHPLVRSMIHELYEPLPKVAGIAIDLYFDHVLANNWDRFHPLSLPEFVSNFYAIEPEPRDQYATEYLLMFEKMRKRNWLEKYKTMEGLTKACQGVSRRISFDNVLDQAPLIYEQFQEKIEKTFITFMEDAIPHHTAFLEEITIDDNSIRR